MLGGQSGQSGDAVYDFVPDGSRVTKTRDIVQTAICQNCHGENGRSGRVGKNIVREVSNMASIVRSGHGGTSYGSRTSYMPKWSTTELTDAELALIKSYVSTL